MNRNLAISDALKLPRDAVTSTLIVYGGKGMGKSNLGSVIAEELSECRLRFSIIDPMGVMWGLRHSADGKGSGIEVLILGGKHGDIPIEPTGGAIVADLVADEEVDVIIDISRHANGKMWGVGERIRFVADYATRLYERQGERMRPLHQIIDEAGRFVPQQIPHGAPEIARCVGAIERLVEEGRNVGVGVTLITQRSARMNKSVSELADCMIAFRTVGPRSVDAILDWFGEHVPKERWKSLVEQLRELDKGTALVVSPGWLRFEGSVPIRLRNTFDSSATPEGGRERRAAGRGARVNLDRYLERMAETVERSKAADPKHLHRRIAELESELSRLKKNPATVEKVETKLERVEVPVFDAKALKTIEKMGEAAKDAADRIEAQLNGFRGTVMGLLHHAQQAQDGARALNRRLEEAAKPAKSNGASRSGSTLAASSSRRFDTKRVASAPVGVDGDMKLNAGARRMLEALAIFQKPLTRNQIATLAQIAPASGTFRNYLGDLRRSGLITMRNDGLVEITTDGFDEVAGVASGPPSSIELLALWKSKFNAGARRMLELLVERHPKSYTRDELGEAAGIVAASGTFRNYLGDLRRAGLVETNGAEVIASDDLFIGG